MPCFMRSRIVRWEPCPSQGLSPAALSRCALARSVKSRYPDAMDSKEAFVALNMIDHVGPVRARQLLEHFGDAAAILSASKSQLRSVRGIGEETADAVAGWEKSVNLAAELKRIQDFGCHVITQIDEN